MALKTIKYAVTSNGITPRTEQAGGIQGEHNVTEVLLALGADLPSGTHYRVQAVDGAGGFYSSEFLTPTENKIIFPLCEDITKAGGVAYLHLVVTEVAYDTNGKYVGENQKFLSKPMRLRFENSGVGSPSETAYRLGITGALLSAQQSAEQAEEAKEGAEAAKAGAETAKSDAEIARDASQLAASEANKQASLAEDGKELADTFKREAYNAMIYAQGYAENAYESQEEASKSATDAQAQAKLAQSSAESAATSVESALKHANSAEEHKSSALEHSRAADKSATAAAISETDAATAAANAKTAAQEALKKLPIIFETTNDMLAWAEGVPDKNLLDISKFVPLDYENEEGATEASIEDDGTIYIRGGNSDFGRVQYMLSLNAGTYTFSVSTYEERSVDGEFLIFINGAVVTGGEYDEYYSKYKHTFVITEQSEVVIRVGCPSQSYGNFYLQVETGETATDYEPYTLVFPECEVGTLLLIKETNVPDYWWDGKVAQPLESTGDLSDYYTKEEVDETIGDIEIALDSIIAIQEELIGGDV